VAHKSLDAVFMLSKIGGEVTFAPPYIKIER